jgi:hypothetical protein
MRNSITQRAYGELRNPLLGARLLKFLLTEVPQDLAPEANEDMRSAAAVSRAHPC